MKNAQLEFLLQTVARSTLKALNFLLDPEDQS